RAVDREGVVKLGATRDEVEDSSRQGPGTMHSIFDEQTRRLDADDLERVRAAQPEQAVDAEWERRGSVEAEAAAEPTEQTVELKEEVLVPHKELREVGQAQIRTQVEEVPGRLEVEAYREEVNIEHVPVGRVVSERVAPWEEDGVLVVPVYEEQLVVTERLLLREH